MFCSSSNNNPENLASENGGEIRVPGSIPAGFYSNGRVEENCVNPQNPSPNPPNPSPNPQNFVRGESIVIYRECQRNHAANIGGHALDGCGEFMADEEDLLKCAACGCHRNFHRREINGEENPPPCDFCRRKRRISDSESPLLPYYSPNLPHGTSHLHTDSDDPDNNSNYPHPDNNNNSDFAHRGGMRKRFRTKFSQDQKDKMYLFAEKVGWRMQKQDEVAVQQFCNEIGVDKGVLKVWMHNNKHTLGKKP